MLWIKKSLNEKGLALPLVFLIAVVFVPVAIGLVVFLKQETIVTRRGKISVQSEQLVEGAAARGLMGLKKRVKTDLAVNLSKIHYDNNQIAAYTTNPMDFIHDCLFDIGSATDVHFSTAPGVNTATLTFSEDMETGSYSTTIIVSTTQAPTWDITGGGTGAPIANLFFKYQVLAQSTSNDGNKISNMLIDSDSPNAVRSNGEFEIEIRKRNFAQYQYFANEFEDNAWYTGGTAGIGPIHYNDEIQFWGHPASGNSTRFTDEITSTSNTACFWPSGGSAYHIDADFYDNGDEIVGAGDVRPTFDAGFVRGIDRIDMPTDVEGVPQMVDQQRAALGLNTTAVVPECSDGVYVANDGAHTTGGIYIQGDVDNMTMSIEGGGDRAVYTINHNNGTTYTIDVDMQNGYTRFNDGMGGNEDYTGTTNGVVFINSGGIDALSGTVQQDSQVTIAATETISITNNLQYADDPLTNPEAQNVLGVISWENDVLIAETAPSDIMIQAAVMAPQGTFQLENLLESDLRGDFYFLGSKIVNKSGCFSSFNSSTGEYVNGYTGGGSCYDQRFLKGVLPPKFPLTDVYRATIIDFNNAPSWIRQ